MKDPDDIEILAAAEHASWSGWMIYMLDKIVKENSRDRGAVLDLPSVRRWLRQMHTLYEDLPEDEKESDRIEARKKLKVYRP